MIELSVNGRPAHVPEGAYLLQAVRAAGADLPTLCQFEGLPPYGASHARSTWNAAIPGRSARAVNCC